MVPTIRPITARAAPDIKVISESHPGLRDSLIAFLISSSFAEMFVKTFSNDATLWEFTGICELKE
jgi:hypothetical protein